MANTAEDTAVHRFTLDAYHRMVEAGILREDDRVELIRGVVREMSPVNDPHVVATTLTRERLSERLTGRASVYEQSPLRLAALASEPQPDVSVYSNPDPRAFGTPYTEPLLVVEVADSSLDYDLTAKAQLYAQGGVPEYWVVDLRHRSLHVFTSPDGGAYRTRSRHSAGTRVAPGAWPDIEIDVESLLPAAPT